jgi:hypothetical protein
MIDQDNIEHKDFSEDLPVIIGKLRFVRRSLISDQVMDLFEQEELAGAGHIIFDVIDDLKIIHESLYGERDKKANQPTIK